MSKPIAEIIAKAAEDFGEEIGHEDGKNLYLQFGDVTVARFGESGLESIEIQDVLNLRGARDCHKWLGECLQFDEWIKSG